MAKEVISVSEALDVAVHFGHQTNRWNPKMARYIYGKKEGIHIIDLTKTVKKVHEAYEFLKKFAKEDKTFLLVGTKKQAQEVILFEAQRAGLFYVVERWLGGTLTNFQTLKKSVARLKELENMEGDGRLAMLPKKEASKLKKEKAKLDKNFSGIKNMDRLPDCMFIVDSHREKIAVAEAKKLGIPIVGLIDTNCDPEEIDCPIPANDDTIRSIKLITSRLVDGILEGRKGSIKPIKPVRNAISNGLKKEKKESSAKAKVKVKHANPEPEKSRFRAKEKVAKEGG